MNLPKSWTSSIAGFALAMLLVTWTLNQFIQLLVAIWPVLALLASCAALLLVGRLYLRRDRW